MNVKTIDILKARKVLELKPGVIAYPHAVVNTPKGMATVCYEGVGWFEDDGMYQILVGDQFNDWMIKLTKSQLLSLVIQEEDMTLHKLIDPHNDRTRSNLWLWENQIKDTPQNVIWSDYNWDRKDEHANV